MVKRVCLTAGCPTLTDRTRCGPCEREREQARGSSTARGYDSKHKRLRADYQLRMDQGEQFICWRCDSLGRPHDVDPSDWQLGHDDHDRTVYRGPECSAGNQATSGRRISPGA